MDDEDGPEDTIHITQRNRAICAALRSLPEKQRLTLELVLLQGCTLREVSDALKESLANTRHYYYRGLRKVRGLLQPEDRLEVHRRRELR